MTAKSKVCTDRCSGSSLPQDLRRVWSRSSPITQPQPLSDKSPGGRCFVKLPQGIPLDSPTPAPHPSRLRLKSSELPSPSEVSSCRHLGRWGTGLNLQMPFLRKEDRFLGLKVSNYVYYRRLKIPCTPLLAALTVTRAHS